MLHLRFICYLILFLAIIPIEVYSQTQPAQVKNVNYFFDPSENELIITYDLVNSSPLELYEIELLFVDGMNIVIRPVSIVGDVGNDVQGGENKRIIWNIFDDVENLSETARPAIQILSINNKPVDPDLAIIMNQIKLQDDKKYHFKMQRDGMLIGGLGCCVGAIVCKLQGDGYIEEQNNAQDLDEYNRAGDNAQKYYTISYVLGGVSAITVGYSLYQYIRDGKSKKTKTALVVTPGFNKGFSFTFSRRF